MATWRSRLSGWRLPEAEDAPREHGSEAASRLEVLYRDHAVHVYRYLLARVAAEDDAAELTAVTFERALSAIERFRPTGGGERAWLVRIARNAAIDAARARRHTTRTGDHLESIAEPGVSTERLVELRLLVEALPGDQRDALHLRYAAGLTAREIGLVLDKSEAAAQKTISRALAALRQEYLDERD